MIEDQLHDTLNQATKAIRDADALIITAGAGMGVDSGLPDFRGNEGFWKAYPPYRNLGLSFVEAANPRHFQHDPAFGWGFYGHRLDLYRRTQPHDGFSLIQRWAGSPSGELFVATSNVDGQFQKAGVSSDAILEVHGSIHHLQCQHLCQEQIWRNNEEILVDITTMRAQSVPLCPHCGTTARPNILMFGDYGWLSQRTAQQEQRFEAFLRRNQTKNITIVEIGAGTDVPTIRHLSESLQRSLGATLIRLNLRQAEGPGATLSLPLPALEGLRALDRRLSSVHKTD